MKYNQGLLEAKLIVACIVFGVVLILAGFLLIKYTCHNDKK